MREPARNRANIARLFQLWEQGKIQPRVTGTYSLADGGKAIASLAIAARSASWSSPSEIGPIPR